MSCRVARPDVVAASYSTNANAKGKEASVAFRYLGRVPFDKNVRKFRFKIEWNRNFPETRFENFGSPLEVVLFSGNLEIPEISCSIWHFYPLGIGISKRFVVRKIGKTKLFQKVVFLLLTSKHHDIDGSRTKHLKTVTYSVWSLFYANFVGYF